MKRNIFLLYLILCYIYPNSIEAENKLGLTVEIYKKLCGVWYLRNTYDTESEYSWGKAKEVNNGSIIIDLGADSPFFSAGPMGDSVINRIYKKNNDVYIINILFRNNKNYSLKVSIIDDNTIIFHEMKWFKEIPLLLKDYGEKKKYFKISGPSEKYYKPKIPNLRIRSKPTLKGIAFRLLNKSEKLFFLSKGNKEKIGNANGNWIKVLTEKNEIGWCFDYYLERLK